MAKKKPDLTREFALDKPDTQLAITLLQDKQKETEAKAVFQKAEGIRKNSQYLLFEVVKGLGTVPGDCPIMLVEKETGEAILKFGKARDETTVDTFALMTALLRNAAKLSMASALKVAEAMRDGGILDVLQFHLGDTKKRFPAEFNAYTAPEAKGARQMTALRALPESKEGVNG